MFLISARDPGVHWVDCQGRAGPGVRPLRLEADAGQAHERGVRGAQLGHSEAKNNV